jgi:predicted alpha/beta hydrolase
MPIESLTLTADDGHRYGVTHYISAAPDAPALLFWPAMGTRARYYSAFAEAIAQQGVQVYVADWRGVDSSSLRASRAINFGYRHLLELDMPALVAAARARHPRAPLWLGGHSLGGQLGALYAAAHPQDIAGLALIASGSVYHRGWRGIGGAGILAMTQSTVVVSSLLGHFPGSRLGFGGREARGVMRDWARVARNGRYRVRGSAHDYEALLPQLNIPVLALGFKHDDFAPRRATDYLLEKMPACARTHWRWGEAEMPGAKLDHFSWARQPQLIAPRVAAWIKQSGAR